jgi:hypothetical protein
VHLYLSKQPEDPDWLARAALFHGHLGPWLVVGTMVGQDAIRRLDTPGHWKIDVTCWMPPDKHRTPFTCMLDGLQAGCGATMGKRNLWLKASDEVPSDGWPVVHIIRLPEEDRPAEGLAYSATSALHQWMSQVRPERLEEISRQMAADEVDRFFRISVMCKNELARAGHGPANPIDAGPLRRA